MPDPDYSREIISQQIDELLKKLQLLAPDTQNPLLAKLQDYQMGGVLEIHNEHPELEETMVLALRLIKNLELAQLTVEHCASTLGIQATNAPYSPKKNDRLEAKRAKVNETDLLELFDTLRTRRSRFESPQNYEQNAYRKGTGTNMAMWYRDIHQRTNKEKLGNCTEQVNVGFVYLYIHVQNELRENHPCPLRSIERVDVDNLIGGHSYLLLDRDKDPLSTFESHLPCKLSLNASESFGLCCVVIDPWNKEYPFYPIADIRSKMPKCGLKGLVNFEFGLNFAQTSELDNLRPGF